MKKILVDQSSSWVPLKNSSTGKEQLCTFLSMCKATYALARGMGPPAAIATPRPFCFSSLTALQADVCSVS